MCIKDKQLITKLKKLIDGWETHDLEATNEMDVWSSSTCALQLEALKSVLTSSEKMHLKMSN